MDLMVWRCEQGCVKSDALCWCFISQLFGEEDADQEVSPDTADPEAACKWLYPVFLRYKPSSYS